MSCPCIWQLWWPSFQSCSCSQKRKRHCNRTAPEMSQTTPMSTKQAHVLNMLYQSTSAKAQATSDPPSEQVFATCYTRTPSDKTTDSLSTKKPTNLNMLCQNTSGRAPDDPTATKQAGIHKRQLNHATIYNLQYQCTSGRAPTDP